ncbi:MAG TPA: TetR/AcrR family transcriptional regulator [Conexibacter sp.]|nr:TetR/AcrR family transcriptional regulator [Conexibacter sp.]
MPRATEDQAQPERVGRPRDPAIDVAVLDATLAALADGGYARLTLEDVARRAGTTKPAIRRRWSGRQRLVLAALSSRLSVPRAPDTGCTLCDLDECLKLFAAAFRRMPAEVLGPLYADCAGDRALRDAFMATLFEPPRAAVEQTLERAHARGDLDERADRQVLLDLIGSFVHYRALFGHAPVGDREIERTVETLLRGAAADYEQLVAHGRQAGGRSAMHRLHA